MTGRSDIDEHGERVAPTANSIASDETALEHERYALFQRFEDWLETPMLVLAFVWLALLIVELIWGANAFFETIGTIIWIIFIANFVIEITLAPRKIAYVKQNWLTTVSLIVPALRIFRLVRVVRVLRLARAGRGLRLVKVVGSLNRAMHALGSTLSRRGFGYVVVLTGIVTLVGAAGMYAFEHEIAGGEGLDSYGEALWWTAMIMTTMGSQYWPQSIEGRLLCFFLALYAFAIFGYVTAMLATYFVGRDIEKHEAGMASAKSMAALKKELTALRAEIHDLIRRQVK